MPLRLSEEEYRDWLKNRNPAVTCAVPSRSIPHGPEEAEEEKPKRSKYGNVRTEVDGIRFDSKHEAAVWQELQARVRAGELWFVLRQVRFPLPGGITYVADFMAFTPDGKIEAVYDAKSPVTKQNRVYILKKKLMKSSYSIEIAEV